MVEHEAVKPEQASPQHEKWHQSVSFLVVALLIVGPFAIPLIWINRKITLLLRIVITAGVLLLCGLLYQTSDYLMETLDQQMAQMRYIRQQFLTPGSP